MDFFSEIEDEIRSGSIKTKRQLEARKVSLAKKFGLERIPGDTEILNSGDFTPEQRQVLRIKQTRTISGVAVVAAMTSPESCPHGRCIYCPGGVENNSPQSYTGYEPAALRGRSHGYEPYDVVFNRIKQLDAIGHDTSKIDLIVMGGTFTARTREYQEFYVKGCLDAMNGFKSNTLNEAINQNETASRRCIGLTVETKPDWFLQDDIDLALSYGTTKVELGIQNLSNQVLELNNRGHTLREVALSSWYARDSGLKIVYHIMPGMYGSTPQQDKDSFDRMITCEAFKPDMLKIYPTLVVKGTSLYKLWKQGKYEPMDTGDAVDVIAYFMSKLPPWIRVQRMQRDIPVQFIEAGVKRSDIRNLVDTRLQEMGLDSNEIRQREVASLKGDTDKLDLHRIRYNASKGKELFISYETEENRLAGFVRLRDPSAEAKRPEVSDSCIVRELKVFGQAVPIHGTDSSAWQHRGLGKKLMQEAEKETKQTFGKDRILVTSGIGVREYFERMGYHKLGPYMAKDLRS